MTALPHGHGPFSAYRRVVNHFFEHSTVTAPDFTRATNIGYLVGTNVTRALVYRAYQPNLYWVRVEVNPHITKHAMNPVREVDVPRVLVALGFEGESRWIPSGACTFFGMPGEWKVRWALMGGGAEHIYFIRFGDAMKLLSPSQVNKEFKKANRITGLNEFLGTLPYTPERLARLQQKFKRWTHPDGGYRMKPPLLRRLGRWCSRQVLKDLGLEPTVPVA